VINATALNDGYEGETVQPLDSDNDGLPDAFEMAYVDYGFNARNPHSFSTELLDGDWDGDMSLDNTFRGDGLININELRGIAKDDENGTITGYFLLVENDWFISCKYAGRDYEARDPYVYFRLLYELIKYSIKKKKPVSAEKATYDAKLRRGFKVIEKRNYLKVNWPFVEDLYIKVLKRVNKAKAENIKRVKSLQ